MDEWTWMDFKNLTMTRSHFTRTTTVWSGFQLISNCGNIDEWLIESHSSGLNGFYFGTRCVWNVRRISRENNSSRARKGLFTTAEIQLFIVIMSLRGPYNSRKYQYCPILQAFYAHNPDKPTWMSLTVSLTWNSQPNWPVCQSKDATWPPFPPINNFLWVKVRLNMFIN